MEFHVETKVNPNKDHYSKSDIDTAFEFSKKVIKEFKSFVRTVAIFGSAARREEKPHDIDILIVVDDVTTELSPELVDAYRIILERIIRDTSKKLHVTTLKLSNFWDYARRGDPVGLNILRDGVALYDTGIFEPLRILLAQGKMLPSEETIRLYANKSKASMHSSENLLLKATLDLYWGVIDISHAVLMRYGEIPASPKKVADLMDEVLVKKRVLEARYPPMMRRFYKLSKSIIKNEINTISGNDYERYKKDATDYVARMRKILDKETDQQKKQESKKKETKEKKK